MRASRRLKGQLLAKKRADSVIATKSARFANAEARLANAMANMHRLLTPEELAGFDAYRLLNSKAKPTAPAALRGRSAHWMKDAITGPVLPFSRRDKLSVGGADDVVPVAAQIGGGM
uniref:Uncharacterized protein n=2 Tax=Mycena chlorophos TaxID=658473 RepID=A0ABQ0L4L5_MYCCL|nr:predicted protein [Mycena chlorophos]